MRNELFFFQPDHLIPLGRKLHDQYVSAEPFPNIVLDDFLPEDVAEALLAAFPPPEFPGFHQPDNEYQIGKQGRLQESYFEGASPFLRHLLAEFNSMVFLDFLEALTDIKGVIPDPHFRGGALHQVLPGGSLAIHADFNRDERRKLDRRINLLFYLNKDWKDEYGGHIELWDKEVTRCVKRAAPVFNRCVIFSTSSTSFHGHPDPLRCPEGMTRKSIALYYYTNGRPEYEIQQSHSTLWRPRPDDPAAVHNPRSQTDSGTNKASADPTCQLSGESNTEH